MNLHRLFILMIFDLRHAIFRLKGLLFLIPSLFFWYWLFKILIDQGTDFLVTKESFIITAWLFNVETARALLINNPPTLSVFLILSVASMPFFVMLAGNNQLAGDAGRKSFRYLLTRCTRLEIFLARFLSSYLLMAGVIICAGTIATYISMQQDSHELLITLRYAKYVVLITLFYALPFFAYMSFVSSFMSSALGTLLNSMVIYVVLLILGHYLFTDFSFLPSGLKDKLFTIDMHDATYVITGLIIYTLVYSGLGWLIFRKRNL